MKTFIDHNFEPIVQINEGGRRVYKTPTGKAYPSVTSVTSLHGEAAIAQWRRRVGHEEANKIAAKAAKRGTGIHQLCETYLKSNDPSDVCAQMLDHDMFESLKPHLDCIDNIHCLETGLYSHKLEVAGTVDCIGEYDGELSVIDFKTAGKLKKREWIQNYFMQTAAYSFMFWEQTGILIKRATIIIGVDHEDAQVFHEPVGNWINEFKGLRKQYRERTGI